jgi:outer membrane biosynthesis protein TonB
VDAVEASAELIDPIEEIEEEDNPTPDPEPTPDPDPDPEPTPDPDPKPTPAPKSTSSSRQSSAPTPRTGDSIPGFMVPLAVALGGFGALMGAYSARRVKLEREKLAGNMDEIDTEDE